VSYKLFVTVYSTARRSAPHPASTNLYRLQRWINSSTCSHVFSGGGGGARAISLLASCVT